MMFISVCEYDKLYPSSIYPKSKNTIPDSAFDWLVTLIAQRHKDSETAFVEHHGSYIKLKNYVGLLETPCGTTIEVLPKITKRLGKSQLDEERQLLLKMLGVVHKLPMYQATNASLEKHSGSLLEVLIAHFLKKVLLLIQRGIRSDYVRTQAEKKFIKGRLRIAQQMRQPLSRKHHFQIEYDCYLPNRPENRLIKTALQWVVKSSKVLDNQRLALELLLSFDTAPQSSRIKADLVCWSTQRDMAHYQPVKPWVELILLRETPWFLSGGWQGISLLFPMEKLFERYVELMLRQDLKAPFHLRSQQKSFSLVKHNKVDMFQLIPDMTLYDEGKLTAVLDAKWKLLDHKADKYGLSQSDFYQLFAYGHKYLKGKGSLLLIYPKTDAFPEKLSPFYFDDQERLVLWVVAFCLKTDTLLIPLDAGLDFIRG